MIGKKLLASAASMAVGVGLLLTSSGVATAADTTFPNADYGFDGNANLVVGGGSTTLYKIAQGFADLYNSTTSCATNNANFAPAATPPAKTAYPQASPAYGQCDPTAQSYNGVNAGGNYDGDNVSIAASTGSSDGIASLNSFANGAAGTYAIEGTNENLPTSGTDTNAQGTSNGFGTVDFAISSRAAKTTGGNCTGGNELTCDTFWGVAADGVQVFTWGSTVSGAIDRTSFANTNGITPTDLFNIYECIDTTWGQLTNYNAAVAAHDPVPPSNAPIVPWAMNSGSGTYADFNNYVAGQTGNTFTADDKDATYSATNPGGSASSPTPPTGKCSRELSNTSQQLPLENDIKPLLQDVQSNQGGLNQTPTSTNNPANWIWFGSNGLLSAYKYLSQPTLFGNQYSTAAQALNGSLPSAATIGTGSYPAERILNVVTRATDATCPVSTTTSKCDLTAGPANANGTTDLNVQGASSGPGGAVREFVRFLCRTRAESQFTSGTTASSPTDPYTGVGDFTEIGTVITNSGFTLPPVADRSPGSDCDVTAAA